jgi:UDP-glucose 4-epimerase
MTVLVTGGAGYIGSHAVQRLLTEGRRVVSLDNLYRGHEQAMQGLAPRHPGRLTFVRGDVTDRALVAGVIREHAVDAVMHFAALAYVGESVDDPIRYYHNNDTGLISVLGACEDAGGVRQFVFSSSCATYGQPPPDMIPVPEDCPQNPVSPYGRSKLHGEQVLLDWAEARRRGGRPVGVAMLRYFNVCGCDLSGLLGEDHTPETHLIPVVLEAALGKRPHVQLFGTDYPTPDGTCIRDYVHVEDLIGAHVLAMERLGAGDVRTYNVGIGKGYSVREIIAAAERVTGRAIRVVEGPRRAGDPPAVFNDPRKVQRELGWAARVTDLDEMIGSAWRWMQANPGGYAGGK